MLLAGECAETRARESDEKVALGREGVSACQSELEAGVTVDHIDFDNNNVNNLNQQTGFVAPLTLAVLRGSYVCS